MQLEDVEGLRREREDLRLLTACQEQRLTQTHMDNEQARAELASLENVLDLLHLREVCVIAKHVCISIHCCCETWSDMVSFSCSKVSYDFLYSSVIYTGHASMETNTSSVSFTKTDYRGPASFT